MFARISAIVVAATLFVGAIAAPVAGSTHTEYEVEQCNGGEIQCCNSVQHAEALDFGTSKLLGLLHIDVAQVTGLVGLTCSGINLAGVGGGSSCSQQQVCCNNNNFNGVVALGCTPINGSL